LKTVATVHRLITARVERDFCDAAALATRRRKHLAGSATAHAIAASGITGTHGFARLPAIRTAVRLVLEALLLVKTLLARAKNEITPTVDARERLIDVHDSKTPLTLVWY
jgi:hypothetical protein